MSKSSQKRPTIPQSIQNELWARAAGRCEFRGCNKILYKDDLTQQRSNLGVISHIVAFSPEGPRGDPIRSKLLEKDIANLILTCRDHGKLIDDKSQENIYTEQELQHYKQEHESRIRVVTSTAQQHQTHVLIIQASINGKDITISINDTYKAILPYYPNTEHPTVIDLSGIRISPEGEAYFSLMTESITQQLNDISRRPAQALHAHSLSIFAIAPIPLLVHVGHFLGSFRRVELYHYHGDTKDWQWKDDADGQAFYTVTHSPDSINSEQKVAVVFSISGLVSRDHITQILGQECYIYEIQAQEPNRLFLRSKKQLEYFRYEVQKMISALHYAHAKRIPIHVFPALPAPFAIEFGRCISSLDTPFIIYEYEDSKHTYVPALKFSKD